MGKGDTSKSVIKGTGIVSGLTLCSRLLGFLWNILLAKLIGDKAAADAFFVAYRIPNLLRSLMAEGALTSAFVPVFASELKKSRKDAQKALSAVLTLILLTTIILSVLGIIFAPLIVSVIAPGFGIGTEKSELCITLTRIMFPYIIFVSIIAMINGALNTVKIFGVSPLAQVTMNCVLIAGTLICGYLEERTAVIILSLSVIIGGFCQIGAQLPLVKRGDFKLRPVSEFMTPATKQMLILMLPAALGAAVYQLTIFVNTMLASLLQSGSVSWLFYADRLSQLPIGVFTIALASVLLPTLANAAAEKDEKTFMQNFMNALRYTSFFMIPISFGLFVYSESIITLLYERGEFTHRSTVMTSLALQAMCFGLWGISCTSMSMRAFIARKDTVTPCLVGVFGLIVSFCLSLSIMGPPTLQKEGAIYNGILLIQGFLTDHILELRLQHVGLALSSGLTATFSFAVLVALLLKRKLIRGLSPFLISTLKSLVASGCMFTCLTYWNRLPLSPTVLLILGIPTGAASYILFTFLLKSSELQETFSTFSRIVNRRVR